LAVRRGWSRGGRRAVRGGGEEEEADSGRVDVGMWRPSRQGRRPLGKGSRGERSRVAH
jgi:hypothetical protein